MHDVFRRFTFRSGGGGGVGGGVVTFCGGLTMRPEVGRGAAEVIRSKRSKATLLYLPPPTPPPPKVSLRFTVAEQTSTLAELPNLRGDWCFGTAVFS